MEINLEKPIFVIYVDIEGRSRQYAEETLKSVNDQYCRYTDATFWIFPSKEYKVELVWNGSKYQDIDKSNMQNLINHVNDILKILSDGTSDESIKSQLRDLKISKILD